MGSRIMSMKYGGLDPIVIFGKGQLAIDICDFLISQGNKILVIPVTPAPEWSPSLLTYCQQNKIQTVSFSELKNSSNRSSLGISIFFDKIFKQDLIDRFNLLLNVHNSPLPKYRGVNPVNWALKNEEKEHGVTLHRVEAGIDTGPVYGTRKFPIDAEKLEVEDLYNICLQEAFTLFCEMFPMLDQILPVNQIESEATYYSAENRIQLGDRLEIRRAN